MTHTSPTPQSRYDEAVAAHGEALTRLARAYERDDDRRRDLLQDIHFALWRSFESFDGRCGLRTWVYRVAHNVAASHVLRDRRYAKRTLVGLDELESLAGAGASPGADVDVDDDRWQLEQLARLLEQLKPLDRQLVLLYLEGLDAGSIGDVTGLSAANVSTKIHRIKRVLALRARTEVLDAS